MAEPLDPDAALMLRVKRGDMRAFEALAEKYKQPIVNMMYRMLHDVDEAEDLAQNVFVRVYQSAKRYEVSAKFSTWIFTIARRLCLNEIRRRGRHPAESLESSQSDHEDQPARQFEDVKTFSPRKRSCMGNWRKKSKRPWRNCRKNSGWPSCYAARTNSPMRKSPKCSDAPSRRRNP